MSKWKEKRVFSTLKGQFDIELKRGDNDNIVVSQRDFYRLMDVMQLFQWILPYNDYILPDEISDYRALIADVHVDRMLDHFLTLCGGNDDDFEKPFDLDRFNGLILITRGRDILVDHIYMFLTEYEETQLIDEPK